MWPMGVAPHAPSPPSHEILSPTSPTSLAQGGRGGNQAVKPKGDSSSFSLLLAPSSAAQLATPFFQPLAWGAPVGEVRQPPLTRPPFRPPAYPLHLPLSPERQPSGNHANQVRAAGPAAGLCPRPPVASPRGPRRLLGSLSDSLGGAAGKIPLGRWSECFSYLCCFLFLFLLLPPGKLT